MEQQYRSIPLHLLEAHPHNPRGPVKPESVQELSESIKEKGVIEPLLVIPVRHPGMAWKIERYRVVAGHRRMIAANLAGLSEVPAIVRDDLSATEQEEHMLTENIQREDLSLLQEAKAYQRLMDTGKTQADVARAVGVNNSRIQQRLMILKLTEPVQELFNQREMPSTAAPILASINSADRQERLAQMIASRRLSVPKLKEMLNKEVECIQTDKEVEKSRSNRSRQKIHPTRTTKIYTRIDAINDLKERNGSSLTFTDIHDTLEGVCEKCGMEEHPEICNACPLPQFIQNLVCKKVGESTATGD